ncbi:DnaD domain-containing protein [Rummeliibacillus sp. TYF-LIM-RU47]|uniref:DnaD domain-containing protein n=1 Tax=Rummeliibacillus sp. TYF-LIM-RU47 TaxID=2608406 RepID=UPI00123A0D5E|nr:DnaD domain protein [Rummeliibacillus sp. TYF-LIM-RU47]
MGIMRVAKNGNYTVMNRTALNDKRLSWKAKGIIAYMLSMPDDWIFYKDELMTHSADGKAAFHSGFKELKDCGYVERRPVKDEKTKKITHWETIVHEIPCEPQTEKPEGGKTTDWKTSEWETRHVENHSQGNPPLLSTDNNQVLKEPNTNRLLSTDNHQPDMNFVKVKGFYESNFSLVSPIIGEMLGGLVDDFDTDLVLYAFEITALNPKVSNPMRYATSILNGWQKNLVTTRKQAEIYESNKRGEQNANNSRGPQKDAGSSNPYDVARGYCSE